MTQEGEIDFFRSLFINHNGTNMFRNFIIIPTTSEENSVYHKIKINSEENHMKKITR
jgi:hypothetical protein